MSKANQQRRFEDEDEDDEEEVDEEESKFHSIAWPNLLFIVVQVILNLGNDILKNLGVEERIEEVGVFFR